MMYTKTAIFLALVGVVGLEIGVAASGGFKLPFFGRKKPENEHNNVFVFKSTPEAIAQQHAAKYRMLLGSELGPGNYQFLRNLAVNLYFKLGYKTDDDLFVFRPDRSSVMGVIKAIRKAPFPLLAETLVATYRLCGKGDERSIAGSTFDQSIKMTPLVTDMRDKMLHRALDKCYEFVGAFGALINAAFSNAKSAAADEYGSADLRDGWFIMQTCRRYLAVDEERLGQEFIKSLTSGSNRAKGKYDHLTVISTTNKAILSELEHELLGRD